MVYPEGTIYANLMPSDAQEIVEEHLLKGRVVPRLIYKGDIAKSGPAGGVPFVAKQQKVVLKNVGVIDPKSFEEYIAVGGYEAVGKALTTMTPEQVIDEIKKSNLRGRGGGRVPDRTQVGVRRQVAPGAPKTIICNADEGEPGNFKDRLILEGDPHRSSRG